MVESMLRKLMFIWFVLLITISTSTVFISAQQTNLTLETNHEVYHPNDKLIVFGNTSSNETVTIIVLNPLNNTIAVAQSEANASGFYNVTVFTFPSTAGGDYIYGNYTIKVSSAGMSLEKAVSFTSRTMMPIQLGSISFVNMLGSPIDKLIPGRLVVIQCKMTNFESTTYNYTFIVQVKNENGVIVSFSFISGSITTKASITPGISWTPSAAGNYTIEVYVWENFISMKPLAKMQSTTTMVMQS